MSERKVSEEQIRYYVNKAKEILRDRTPEERQAIAEKQRQGL